MVGISKLLKLISWMEHPLLTSSLMCIKFDHRDEVVNGWVDKTQLGENKGKSITPKSLREAQK